MSRPRRVSAGELGWFVRCERAALLDHRDPPPETAMRAEGRRQHDAFATELGRHHGRRECFIASVVYGERDPRTESLRAYRDRLLRRRAGRVAVAVYYGVAPWVARALRRAPGLQPVARWGVDCWRERVAERGERMLGKGDRDVD